jgi:hypothetical protein
MSTGESAWMDEVNAWMDEVNAWKLMGDFVIHNSREQID